MCRHTLLVVDSQCPSRGFCALLIKCLVGRWLLCLALYQNHNVLLCVSIDGGGDGGWGAGWEMEDGDTGQRVYLVRASVWYPLGGARRLLKMPRTLAFISVRLAQKVVKTLAPAISAALHIHALRNWLFETLCCRFAPTQPLSTLRAWGVHAS